MMTQYIKAGQDDFFWCAFVYLNFLKYLFYGVTFYMGFFNYFICIFCLLLDVIIIKTLQCHFMFLKGELQIKLLTTGIFLLCRGYI